MIVHALASAFLAGKRLAWLDVRALLLLVIQRTIDLLHRGVSVFAFELLRTRMPLPV